MSRNKYFYIFTALIILMFPSTLYMQSDKDKTIIVTTMGVDYQDDEYELTTLAITPLGGQDTNVNLEIFTATGKTIAEALENISNNTGKNVGLAHCDCIILSMDTLSSNITHTLDYFTRTSNLTTNATLVATDGKSKDLIEATKSSHDLLNLSVKNIVLYQEGKSVLNNVNIEKFYRNYLSHSSSFYMPVLSVKESDESSSSPGNSGGSENSQSQKKIQNDNRMIVLKHGEYIGEIDEDEKMIYNIISNDAKQLEITIEDVNDEYVTSSTEVYQQTEKLLIPWYSFDGDTPIVTYNVWLSFTIDEIESMDNHSSTALSGIIQYLTPTAEQLIRKKVDENLSSTITKMRDKNIDIMRLYEHFNAYHYSKWKKYLSSLPDETHYLDGVDLRINLHLNYVV